MILAVVLSVNLRDTCPQRFCTFFDPLEILKKKKKAFRDGRYKLDIVTYTSVPVILIGWSRQTLWTQEFKTNLLNIARLYLNKTKDSSVFQIRIDSLIMYYGGKWESENCPFHVRFSGLCCPPKAAHGNPRMHVHCTVTCRTLPWD